MSVNELIATLRAASRQSLDAAVSAEASAKAHRPAYEEIVINRRPEDHDRALELYEHVIANDNRARQLRHEAAAFKEAADFIDDLGSCPTMGNR